MPAKATHLLAIRYYGEDIPLFNQCAEALNYRWSYFMAIVKAQMWVQGRPLVVMGAYSTSLWLHGKVSFQVGIKCVFLSFNQSESFFYCHCLLVWL